MKYCPKCDIKADWSSADCPICFTILRDANDIEPDPIPESPVGLYELLQEERKKNAELTKRNEAVTILAEGRLDLLNNQEARHKKELADLAEWKRQALEIQKEWSPQAVGSLLGVKLGELIYPAIEPGIKKLIEERDELKSYLCRIKLPVPIKLFSALCANFPGKDVYCTEKEGYLCIYRK